MGNGYSESQKQWIYNLRAKRDTITIQSEKGMKDRIREHNKENGESMNAFINRAIVETIERDKEKRMKDKQSK